MTASLILLQKEHIVLEDKLARGWTALNYALLAWTWILPKKFVPSLNWKSTSTTAVSSLSSVTVVVLGVCHREVTRSHMIKAAALCTAPALSRATNIFATSSARMHFIIVSIVVINNIGLGRATGLVKGQDKDPMKKNPLRKYPATTDQAMLCSNCNQIGPGNITLREVHLFLYFVHLEAKDVKNWPHKNGGYDAQLLSGKNSDSFRDEVARRFCAVIISSLGFCF